MRSLVFICNHRDFIQLYSAACVTVMSYGLLYLYDITSSCISRNRLWNDLALFEMGVVSGGMYRTPFAASAS
jgi:hypothetical protein